MQRGEAAVAKCLGLAGKWLADQRFHLLRQQLEQQPTLFRLTELGEVRRGEGIVTCRCGGGLAGRQLRGRRPFRQQPLDHLRPVHRGAVHEGMCHGLQQAFTIILALV